MTPPYVKEGKPPKVVSFIVHDNEFKALWGTKSATAVALSENGEIMDQWTFVYL